MNSAANSETITNTTTGGIGKDREDEEVTRRNRRKVLRTLNVEHTVEEHTKSLDSSLKRHTALIKRMRQSMGMDNNEQILKDIISLSLEKYIDELASATLEGIARCKSERDVWSAVEIISAIHRRFPKQYTPAAVNLLTAALAPPQRAQGLASSATVQASAPSGTALGGAQATGPTAAQMSAEQKEKEDSARVMRQRPILRVCAELALVGIIRDAPGRSGGEWVMKTLKDLLSNDPSLSSLPLLSTFLKTYARPYLGISPVMAARSQLSEGVEPGLLAPTTQEKAQDFPPLTKENESDELVEKEIRVRFKKMCEGYFDNVSKKLLIEHKRLQEQDRRNHEAYIRSGEIFEDRQQAYEKMAKAYERLLTSCQTLSELLFVPMPSLPINTQKNESIAISALGTQDIQEELFTTGGKWEDEEERRFFEDIQDLRDFVPKSLLGINEQGDGEEDGDGDKKTEEELMNEKEKRDQEEAEVLELEKELKRLEQEDAKQNGDFIDSTVTIEYESQSKEYGGNNIPSPPKTLSPSQTPPLAPQGPSQLLTTLLARLPDCTNRSLIDSAAVEFAFLNSKAARKRLVKFLAQVPKNRIDLLPHYSRLVATLNKYMPDIGSDLITFLEDDFRYLQRKKNVVKELSEVRQKNMTFLSNLTKFKVVPTHVILHIFKVCLDDFTGVNVENLALLLEGCGRFLLRSDETKERFGTMIELVRRKQSLAHLDQRQILLLENAYYQCNPPERVPMKEKERTPIQSFVRHLIHDVLSKKTIDKVLKLIRKLDWGDQAIVRDLHKVFTKPWKLKYSSISLLAMLSYDLQRYHAEFSVAIVDQVLENIRRGLETNVYKQNQQRVATIKFLGELYIYRLISSGIVFDTLWSLVTYGHPEGKPLPGQPCPVDMPDDFFRPRLICVLLDTCGMCFDKGSQRKKLDNFLTFFQLYILTKEHPPMDVEFMLEDSFEALNPKLIRYKSFEEAAQAVDELFNRALQNAGVIDPDADGEDSGDDSDEDREDEIRRGSDEDEDDTQTVSDSGSNERPPSPDTLVVLNTSEHQGPTEEDESEFAKEFAKMVTESSAEARKVDKRTAQALWDSAVLPTGIRKKKQEESEDEGGPLDAADTQVMDKMKFTLLTKKGNKQQAKTIAIPTNTALATHTRTAQMQDKVEQQHLKQLVLDYEHREEVEEWRALESRSKTGAIKIRYVG